MHRGNRKGSYSSFDFRMGRPLMVLLTMMFTPVRKVIVR